MRYPHVIRLRGPWEFEVLSRADAPACEESPARPTTGKARLPCDWSEALGRRFRGCVRYRRRFNRPTGLDPHERVWLVVEGVDAFGRAALNGQALGDVLGYALPASFDVTELLAPSNELLLDVELSADSGNGSTVLRPGRENMPGGPIGEVRLEVRSSAFVERLAIWMTAEEHAVRLHARGRIGGAAAISPLAVAVNGDHRELLYGEMKAGESFELSSPLDGLPGRPGSAAASALRLEIKLLAGGVALWQCEQETAAADVKASAADTLSVAGAAASLPLPVLEIASPATDVGQRSPTAVALKAPVFGLRQILPEAIYTDFDHAGRAVVQAVPLAWAEEVCARFAHHGSIVAWTAGAAELAEAGEERLKRLGFGRLWLPSEKALG